MAIQSATTVELRIAKEQSQGVLPGGAKFRKLERVSGAVSLEKDTYSSARIRSDRQKADSRHGVRRATGQIRDEISIGASDLLLEGAVGGAWVNGISKSATADLGADGTLLGPAGAFSGLFAGLTVSVEGLAGQAEGADPIVAKIVSISADGSSLVLEKKDPDAADWVVSDDAAVTVTNEGRTLKNGKVDVSYAVEQYFPEIGGTNKFLYASGVKVDTAAVDLPTTGLATVTYSLRGLNAVKASVAKDSTPLEPIPGSLAAAVNGAVYIDGVKNALITQFSMNIANGVAGDPVVGSNFVPKLFDAPIAVTGSITAYLEDMTLFDKFDDEIHISLVVDLDGGDGTYLNTILGNVVVNGATLTADGTGGATITGNWEALIDPATNAVVIFQSSYVPA